MNKLLSKLRFQYSLRSLMIGVTLVCVLCSIATYIGWEYIGNLFYATLSSVGTSIGWRVPLTIVVLGIVGSIIVLVRGVAVVRSVEFVRLAGAVIVALMACWFVGAYGDMAFIRFQFDHPGRISRSTVSQFVTSYGNCAYAIPALGLALGCVFVWVWPKSKVLLEVVIQSLWILALAWAALVLLIWEIQNIPVFSGNQLHY